MNYSKYLLMLFAFSAMNSSFCMKETYKKITLRTENTEKNDIGVKLFDVTNSSTDDLGNILVNNSYFPKGAQEIKSTCVHFFYTKELPKTNELIDLSKDLFNKNHQKLEKNSRAISFDYARLNETDQKKLTTVLTNDKKIDFLKTFEKQLKVVKKSNKKLTLNEIMNDVPDRECITMLMGRYFILSKDIE